MTKAALLKTMRAERERWDALLGSINPPRRIQAGAEGTWSVKDVIAHIAAYERELAESLERIARSQPAGRSPTRLLPMEERNARWYEADRGRSFAEVEAAAQQVFARLLRAIDAFSEDDLRNQTGFGDVVVDEEPWKAFAGESYEHYDEHRPSIEAWRALPDG